jgi:hypothetical protein
VTDYFAPFEIQELFSRSDTATGSSFAHSLHSTGLHKSLFGHRTQQQTEDDNINKENSDNTCNQQQPKLHKEYTCLSFLSPVSPQLQHNNNNNKQTTKSKTGNNTLTTSSSCSYHHLHHPPSASTSTPSTTTTTTTSSNPTEATPGQLYRPLRAERKHRGDCSS